MATSDSPLSVPNITLAVARQAGTVDPDPGGGTVVVGTPLVGNIFTNGLEEASFDASETADGAGWDRTASTTISIVRDDQYVVANDGSDDITPNGPISGRQWENSPMAPAGGSHALRCRFGGSVSGDGMAEARFKLGSFTPVDVWLGFDIRVPINFFHRSVSGPSNNKLIRLFHSSYTSGGKCGMEFRHDGSGGSNFYLMSDQDGNASPGKAGADIPFCSIADRGRWMRIVFRARSETSPLAGDGLLQVYRRWEDEPSLVLLDEVTNARLQRGDGVVPGFNEGYLMGYANSGYDADTEWLLDNFVIGTEPMV